ARVLAGSRALPGHLLAPVPRDLDPWRLGLGGRGRLLVPSRTLRRHPEHRREANRAGRAGVCGSGASGRAGGGGGRGPARGQGRGRLDLLRPRTGGVGGGDGLAAEVGELVARELGKAFRPDRVVFVNALPKTRSAKIMRRAVRAKAVGTDPGDLSSLENPEALDEIGRVVGAFR